MRCTCRHAPVCYRKRDAVGNAPAMHAASNFHHWRSADSGASAEESRAISSATPSGNDRGCLDAATKAKRSKGLIRSGALRIGKDGCMRWARRGSVT